MTGIRDYIWFFPFIGAILTAISLFTPSLVFPSGINFVLQFMDGFYVIIGGGYGPSVGFTHIPGLMIVGIISTVLLAICTIILFISAFSHRRKKAPVSWIILGIILIGGTIYYIGGSQLAYFIYRIINDGYPTSFWQGRIPSFASIAPFIGGGTSILSFIVSRITGEQEVDIKPVDKKESYENIYRAPINEELSHTFPTAQTHIAKFCPVCGVKLENPEGRFCPSCGSDVKK
ncbi:MAG: hypothetical protein ACFFCV_01520 [Promethearchaeota archaeon]